MTRLMPAGILLHGSRAVSGKVRHRIDAANTLHTLVIEKTCAFQGGSSRNRPQVCRSLPSRT